MRLVAYGGIRDGRRRLLPGATEGRVASPPRWLGSSENGPRAGGTGGRPGADASSRATYGLSPGYGQHGIARRVHHVFRAADRGAADGGRARDRKSTRLNSSHGY